MTPTNLLDELARRGATLARDGDQLHYSGPKGALTQALRDEIAANKPAILAMLGEAPAPCEQTHGTRSEADEALAPYRALIADAEQGLLPSHDIQIDVGRGQTVGDANLFVRWAVGEIRQSFEPQHSDLPHWKDLRTLRMYGLHIVAAVLGYARTAL